MKKNVGTADRWIRVILGVLLLWFAVSGNITMPWLAGIIGIILLATGAIGYCTLYQLFGISTCSKSLGK